jgi:GNAT superfamily N-acetyltransferase
MRHAAFASASLPATLRDGRTVAIRRSTPADERALREFLEGLCLEARRLRFFTGAVDVERAAREGVAGPNQVGLLALGEDGELLGHALFIALPGPGPLRAEVAVEVADQLHGLGLGTILIERLSEIAERRGIERLVAEVLPDNREMLEVFEDGFDATVEWEDGIERIEFPASAWRLAHARYAA